MFDQFKPIMQNGERYVVVEDGRPQYVLMRFHDYVLLLATQQGTVLGSTSPFAGAARSGLEAVNAELSGATGAASGFADPDAAGVPPVTLPTGETTVHLEDLPL